MSKPSNLNQPPAKQDSSSTVQPAHLPAPPVPTSSLRQAKIYWILYWLPVLLIMAVIYALSDRPEFGRGGLLVMWAGRLLDGSPLLPWLLPFLQRLDPFASYIAHFVEYAILALALYWALSRTLPRLQWKYLTAWLIAVLYAISDEWHQSFVPGRTPSVQDVLVDAAGAATALAILYLWQRHRSPVSRAKANAGTSVH
jgi:VanZ family protein